MKYSNKRRKIVYEKFNGHCSYCGKKLNFDDMQIDHHVPKNKNGGSDIHNLYPSCQNCNLLKYDLSIEDFRKKIESMFTSLMDHPHIRIMHQLGFVNFTHGPVVFFYEIYERNRLWLDR